MWNFCCTFAADFEIYPVWSAKRCRDGGIGRHEGLKILWPVMAVPVRPRLAVPETGCSALCLPFCFAHLPVSFLLIVPSFTGHFHWHFVRISFASRTSLSGRSPLCFRYFYLRTVFFLPINSNNLWFFMAKTNIFLYNSKKCRIFAAQKHINSIRIMAQPHSYLTPKLKQVEQTGILVDR